MNKMPINCQLPGAELLAEGKSVAEVMQTLEKELNPQQERFCREYVIDDNASKSYQRAYKCSYETARANSSRLLTDATIKKRVEELRDERNKRLELSADAVLRRLAAILKFDPRDLYDEAGNLKPVHELDHDTAIALQAIEVDEIFSGKGDERTAIGLTKKVKFAGTREIIELAGKHFKLWKEVGSNDNPVMVVNKIELVGLTSED